MEKEVKTTEVRRHLSGIFSRSHELSNPLYLLEQKRLQLESRSLQAFDHEEILQEMGSIQKKSRELNDAMLNLYDFLKQSRS